MPKSQFNIMLSAAGRRVELGRLLQRTLAEMNLTGRVLAMDINRITPAMHTLPDRVVVPPYRDPGCLDFLLDLCRKWPLQLIIPTIDPELLFYARHQNRFQEADCRINISSEPTIIIGGDKVATHQFLTANGFPTVRQMPLDSLLDNPNQMEFPFVIKPRFGSASQGITIARNPQQLAARAGEKDMLVQAMAQGKEYTVDVFVDSKGQCRCAVPRLRLETRGGEVSKGVTVRNQKVIDLAWKIAQALPGAYGVLNIQMFHDAKTDALNVIEINPRFGGGYPLAHQAGANMIKWVIEDVMGIDSTARDDQWKDGLVMLRYDDAVFVDAAATGVELPQVQAGER